MLILNPILRGFCPDPSIVRVGEDYYIATSTFEWFPGVRLHHSRDLVHWRQIGHALTRPSQLELRGVPDSGGVWAPSLSYADGQFWLVYTTVRGFGLGRPFKDLGIYLTTAPAITGPWSDPVVLNSVGFDPSLFHDDDGRKWVVNMAWDHRQAGVARFAGIVVQEYDPRQRRLVGPLTKILQRPILAEGPNLYRRAGWYYLMTAEGGTGWEHRIAMARSRTLTGPYELDPQPAVLTTRDAPDHPLQKAGHGELVETTNGEWYLAHLASRPIRVGEARRCILGRETCLQRVRWTDDGWLRLDNASTSAAEVGRSGNETGRAVPGETARAAAWHPAVHVPAPQRSAPQAWPRAARRDDFDKATLDASWSALRVPIDDSWATLSTRRGWLTLRGRESLHSTFFQSLLAKPLRSTRCVIETCLEFQPRAFSEMAGLVCYYDTRTHYYLRVTCDERLGAVIGVVQTDDAVYREPPAAEQVSVAGWPRYFLRAVVQDAALQFSASPDGVAWRDIGAVLDASKLSDDYGGALHFTGAMAGLCVQDLAGNGATAQFDYFSMIDQAE